MTTDELIMQEMLDRATNPSKEATDEISSEMFCMLVKNNALLITKAQEMIVAKISGTNVAEATKAIGLLEDCMRKCGPAFQDEVAKNRFLNNFIRLVLKKYDGAKTPMPIKQRILECLLLWTTEYADKTKIRIVYDLLAKDGDVELLTANPSMISNQQQLNVFEKRESILGKDEELLRVLLNSKDKENLKRANMLIQARVKQDSRRTELLLQRKCKLQEIEETVNVLAQMLDNYEEVCGKNKGAGDASCDTMQELYYACKRHKPVVKQLLDMLEGTEAAEDSLRAETLSTNDSLRNVLERYKTLFNTSPSRVEANGSSSATAATRPTATPITSNTDLLSDLLAGPAATLDEASGNSGPTESVLTAAAATAKPTELNTLEELHQIFGAAEPQQTNNQQLNDLFGNLDMLEPIAVNDDNKEGGRDGQSLTPQAAERKTFRDLPEIDELSEALLKQSLQAKERVITFKKEPEKLTLNDLVKERSNVKPTPATPTTTPTEPADHDDCMLLSDEPEETPEEVRAPEPTPRTTKAEEPTKAAAEQVKHLQDISLDLDDVTPLEERLLLEDSDVKITLNFTENRPSKEVSVMVLSVTNKSKAAIRDFQLEATVKKPSKVRLLKATGDSMEPCKPFRPPPLINQMMLLLNPTQHSVDVSCIVTYKLGDDPDPVNELLVVKDVPYV